MPTAQTQGGGPEHGAIGLLLTLALTGKLMEKQCVYVLETVSSLM